MSAYFVCSILDTRNEFIALALVFVLFVSLHCVYLFAQFFGILFWTHCGPLFLSTCQRMWQLFCTGHQRHSKWQQQGQRQANSMYNVHYTIWPRFVRVSYKTDAISSECGEWKVGKLNREWHFRSLRVAQQNLHERNCKTFLTEAVWWQHSKKT